jgi:hypothetical protein
MGLAFALTAGSSVLAPSAGANDPWLSVKAATARFHSFEQAQRAGYTTEGEPCVSSPAGAMGIHAVNRSSASDQSIDPDRPEIILYLPRQNGELELTGVEYFEVALANTPSGPAPWFGAAAPEDGFFTPTPTIFGHAFDGPMPGHHPLMPWHYDLHVWLWESNPDGLFAPFNPALSCPAA